VRAPDAFSATRIRLADIDGSGTNDIIYLGKRQISCLLNLSGNAFAGTPIVIDTLPELRQADITVTDLSTGTSHRVVQSAGQDRNRRTLHRRWAAAGRIDDWLPQQPLGRRCGWTIRRRPLLYRRKQAGRPWSAKLHFPVQCLSRVERSTMSTSAGQPYRYRHGYCDHAGVRGFGMSKNATPSNSNTGCWAAPPLIVDNTLPRAGGRALGFRQHDRTSTDCSDCLPQLPQRAARQGFCHAS
jgi:hypothetical protein